MKKYKIAKNEKELHNNYKVIAKNYFKGKKSTFIKNIPSHAWSALRLKSISSVYEQRLYELYFEEIELYYLNNDFSKRNLQIESVYLKRQQQQRYGTVVPLFLSILASLIYWIFFTCYLGGIGKVFKNINEMLHEQQLDWIDYIKYMVDYELLNCFLTFLVFLVTIILLVWLIITVGNIVGYFVGGPNTNKEIAEQYRQDYLENLISYDKYFELTKILSKDAETFSVYLKQIGDDENSQKDITMESLEEEVEKRFFQSTNKKVDDEMIKIWGKSLISKSIIYRAFLNVEKNEKILSDIFQQIVNK